ncbi:MAG: hypothetical protein WDO73_35995 [Ignavibacteriota bacterium]
MRKVLRFLIPAVLLVATLAVRGDRDASDERLSFQTGGPWEPRVNVDGDVAMVYGIGPEPAVHNCKLAGTRLRHSCHDRRGVGSVSGLSQRPVRWLAALG